MVVIAGSSAPDDEVASWAYSVRAVSGRLPVALYHRPLNLPSAAWRARALPTAPLAALADLLEIIDGEDRIDAGARGANRHDVWAHSPDRAAAAAVAQ
jgi:hypothetical protein